MIVYVDYDGTKKELFRLGEGEEIAWEFGKDMHMLLYLKQTEFLGGPVVRTVLPLLMA